MISRQTTFVGGLFIIEQRKSSKGLNHIIESLWQKAIYAKYTLEAREPWALRKL